MPQAIIYIRQHFKEQICLATISSALGYSPKYVSNCISKINNYTLPLIVNSLRVDFAKELLINTDMKIIDVGSASGYNNEKSFYRAFYSITKMTPSAYRKKNR